jgi:hypothetical protein
MRAIACLLAIAGLLLGLALPAAASPFLVTDPVDANADQCVYQVKGGPVQSFPVLLEAGQRICKINLSSAAVGVNDITLRVRNNLWGTESPAVPFVFTRPGSLPVPANTRIAP